MSGSRMIAVDGKRRSMPLSGGIRADRPRAAPPITAALMAGMCLGCSAGPAGYPYKVGDFALRDVARHEHFLENDGQAPREPLPNEDENGVQQMVVDGVPRYNPVKVAQDGIWHAASYLEAMEAGDVAGAAYDRAKTVSHADTLWGLRVEHEGAAYFPYEYPTRIFVDYPAPWYSGMAQGLGLDLFVRAYQITGDRKYLEWSEAVFLTFRRLRSEGAPWTCFVDDEGFYWIEEYAHPAGHAAQVLNGKIYAMAGLYDFWRETGRGRPQLAAALATIARYAESFNVEGGFSRYSLLETGESGSGPKNAFYHDVHIRQLRFLHAITGDRTFLRLARRFEAAPSAEAKARVGVAESR